MSQNTLQKKIPAPIKEKGQYVMAFGVIAAMLYASGFPFFVIFFLGVLSYFIWKMFTAAARIETRRVFEFYLSANEILRDDERRWFGFEIKDAIAKGDTIVKSMSGAPPLLYYALGALNHKIGDHAAAVKNLSNVFEDASSQESAIVFPTSELRDYVKLLRKIEREPAEAPLTSAAIRSLERARKSLGKKLLEESRQHLDNASHARIENGAANQGSFKEMLKSDDSYEAADFGSERPTKSEGALRYQFIDSPATPKPVKHGNPDTFTDRKSISEVLHDIYDKNVQ